MVQLNAFDAVTMVGRHKQWRAGEPCAADELLADMDHYGIAEAMVMDCLTREFHPQAGNPRSVAIARQSERLHPAWSALPNGAKEEQVDGETLVAQMREQKVGALYLFPNQHQFNLADWCVDWLLEPLAAAGVPVVINPVEHGPRVAHGQDGTDWKGVVDLCQRWPTLPVVVSERRIRRSQRLLYRALDACENLHLELSAYWLHHGIEYLARGGGAHRLVFGSGWPMVGPHMTLATLACAEIDDKAKRAIAGDNWRRLIRWCEPVHPVVEPAEPADAYVAFGRTGERPAGMTFQDCHGHLSLHCNHYHIPDHELDEIVREMDRLGVEKVCVFGLSGVFSDEQPDNDYVAEAVRRYPERFVGFTLVNPFRGPEEMRRELERGAAMGMRGVKLIPSYQGYPEEGPNIDVACQWAHERGELILNHEWGSPEQMRRLVTTYPNACFLTGHTTTKYAEVMREHENLYVCSCPLLGPRACEQVVEAIGAERFMFGSDLTDLPIAWGLGPILLARISAEEKRLILGGNLARLLEKYSVSSADAVQSGEA
ncbi:MAG: amidohydrolase family protein [Phycisphaeraceae bacterium]